MLGVNLEGLEYNGRPLYRLIQRELANALIFDVIRKLQQPHTIEVTLVRDAWYGPTAPRARPLHYLDRFVLPGIPDNLNENAWSRALPIGKLSAEEWRHALETSLDCFLESDEPDWREITFYDCHTGQPESNPRPHLYEMTPHLIFRSALSLDPPATWNALAKAIHHARGVGKTLGESWPEGKEALVVAMQRAKQRMQPLYDFVKGESV